MDESAGGAEEVFQEEGSEDENEKDMDYRKWKKELKALGETFTLKLNGVDVTMLTPKSWKSDTNCVKLEKECLEAFLGFVVMDVEDCFGQQKRNTTKGKDQLLAPLEKNLLDEHIAVAEKTVKADSGSKF